MIVVVIVIRRNLLLILSKIQADFHEVEMI